MRTIEIPSLALDVNNSTETIDFSWFVGALLNQDSRFNQTGAGIRRAVRIERALERGKPVGAFVLDEADWFELSEAAEHPSAGYPIAQARRLMPFIQAIAAAKPADGAPSE